MKLLVCIVLIACVFATSVDNSRLFLKGLAESYLPGTDSSACLNSSSQISFSKAVEKIYEDIIKNEPIRTVFTDTMALSPLIVNMVVDCHISDVFETASEIVEEKGMKGIATIIAMNFKWIEVRFWSTIKLIASKEYEEAGI